MLPVVLNQPSWATWWSQSVELTNVTYQNCWARAWDFFIVIPPICTICNTVSCLEALLLCQWPSKSAMVSSSSCIPEVAFSTSDLHLGLSGSCEGVSFSWPASLVLPVRECTTRFVPYGARINMFSMEEMVWRMGMIHGYLASREHCLCFYDVASVKLDGWSLSGCQYALSPMWSREVENIEISSKFLETEGRQSWYRLLSHSGCFARIVETSVAKVI